MAEEAGQDLRAVVRRLIAGHRMTQALGLAAQLALADLLADGPRSCDELARLRGCNPEALYRVLRMLASEGVFLEVAARRFALTPAAELLRTDSGASLRALALIEAREWSVAWSELAFSVATSEAAFPRIFGVAAAEYYAQRPPARALFDEVTTGEAVEVAGALAASYDFSGIDVVAELEAGSASLLPALLSANSALHGRAFVAGAAPPGASAYLVQMALTGWDDESLIDVLRGVRAVMDGAARLLALEPLVVAEQGALPGPWEDVNRLVMSGVRVRSLAEYEELLRSAGLRLMRVLPAGAARTLLEAGPA